MKFFNSYSELAAGQEPHFQDYGVLAATCQGQGQYSVSNEEESPNKMEIFPESIYGPSEIYKEQLKQSCISHGKYIREQLVSTDQDKLAALKMML